MERVKVPRVNHRNKLKNLEFLDYLFYLILVIVVNLQFLNQCRKKNRNKIHRKKMIDYRMDDSFYKFIILFLRR